MKPSWVMTMPQRMHLRSEVSFTLLAVPTYSSGRQKSIGQQKSRLHTPAVPVTAPADTLPRWKYLHDERRLSARAGCSLKDGNALPLVRASLRADD